MFNSREGNRVAPYSKQLEKKRMGLKHDVYPATRMGIALEEWCRENNESISGMYKEGIRRMAEDPNHPLELDTEVDLEE